MEIKMWKGKCGSDRSVQVKKCFDKCDASYKEILAQQNLFFFLLTAANAVFPHAKYYTVDEGISF